MKSIVIFAVALFTLVSLNQVNAAEKLCLCPCSHEHSVSSNSTSPVDESQIDFNVEKKEESPDDSSNDKSWEQLIPHLNIPHDEIEKIMNMFSRNRVKIIQLISNNAWNELISFLTRKSEESSINSNIDWKNILNSRRGKNIVNDWISRAHDIDSVDATTASVDVGVEETNDSQSTSSVSASSRENKKDEVDHIDRKDESTWTHEHEHEHEHGSSGDKESTEETHTTDETTHHDEEKDKDEDETTTNVSDHVSAEDNNIKVDTWKPEVIQLPENLHKEHETTETVKNDVSNISEKEIEQDEDEQVKVIEETTNSPDVPTDEDDSSSEDVSRVSHVPSRVEGETRTVEASESTQEETDGKSVNDNSEIEHSSNNNDDVNDDVVENVSKDSGVSKEDLQDAVEENQKSPNGVDGWWNLIVKATGDTDKDDNQQIMKVIHDNEGKIQQITRDGDWSLLIKLLQSKIDSINLKFKIDWESVFSGRRGLLFKSLLSTWASTGPRESQSLDLNSWLKVSLIPSTLSPEEKGNFDKLVHLIKENQRVLSRLINEGKQKEAQDLIMNEATKRGIVLQITGDKDNSSSIIFRVVRELISHKNQEIDVLSLLSSLKKQLASSLTSMIRSGANGFFKTIFAPLSSSNGPSSIGSFIRSTGRAAASTIRDSLGKVNSFIPSFSASVSSSSRPVHSVSTRTASSHSIGSTSGRFARSTKNSMHPMQLYSQ